MSKKRKKAGRRPERSKPRPPPRGRLRTERIDDFRWEIPIQGTMKVPGRIFADDRLWAEIGGDQCLEQVANVASLPGIVGHSLAMPDVHWGYGFPIGGVAAFDPDQGGVVSPGGVGYDINCGVRLMRSNLTSADLEGRWDELAVALQEAIPSGIGSRGELDLSDRDLDAVMTRGAEWAVEQGHGVGGDLDVIEEGGVLAGADPGAVSKRAKQRGRTQLGSLGSGNHFAEVGRVAEIYDPEAAEAFGLFQDQITLMIHSGSRGFGHQICDDSLHDMLVAASKQKIELPDRQLAAALLGSPEAEKYLAAMRCAVNFAFANRQVMLSGAREVIHRLLGGTKADLGLDLIYDVCHNIAKWEEHEVDGEFRRLCVHRKGATRAFGPGHEDVPERYRAIGQPVLVPGDMGRYSFVLRGTAGAMRETFGSSCHGAGRLLSRNKARQQAAGRSIFDEMTEQGVLVKAKHWKTVAEEMPEAYKDVADVVGVIEGAGLAARVARLEPLVVVKG